MTDLIVFGAGGQVGRALCEAGGAGVTGYDRQAVDISDAESVARAVTDATTVVNAAAYTQVDDAESEPDAAYAVITTEKCALTGQSLIDEQVLSEHGVSDFVPYAVEPDNKDALISDLYL